MCFNNELNSEGFRVVTLSQLQFCSMTHVADPSMHAQTLALLLAILEQDYYLLLQYLP